MNTVPASAFLGIGQSMMYLGNPHAVASDAYVQAIEDLIKQLKACEFVSTAATAKTLSEYSYPYNKFTNRFSDESVVHLKSCVKAIANSLSHESEGCRLVRLQADVVPTGFRDLGTTVNLTETQSRLQDETIHCLEVSAYRSAAVMGWNLAYDFIRQWVFDNALGTFQNYLGAMYSQKSPISDYADFWTADRPLSEFEFLRVCRGPGGQQNILRDKLIDDLVHYLRQRNNYAHPNFIQPSANKTNAYIEHLIDAITGSPFR